MTWLQPYNNNADASEIGLINHYRKGTMQHTKDPSWRHNELQGYSNEIREVLKRITSKSKHALSTDERKRIEDHMEHLETNQRSDQQIFKPDGRGGTRKSKLSKPKYRSHSRVRILKSKSKSKRRQKKIIIT